jgi:pimeloyl-ACP methyl ester carboxylesterase
MRSVTVGGACLEYERIEATCPAHPTIVMLHEGLGCVATWKEFPAALAQATGCATLVYSRRGYGGSDPLTAPRSVRYMHEEALEILPELLAQLEIERPVLFGHSDGASIALIHAGASGRAVAGVIALAPHVMVEGISVTGIAAARTAYQTADLRARLARHHADVDGAFWGWNDIWLSSEFRHWNIEEYLPRVACPILAVQGEDDEYGTMEQIERIVQQAHNVKTIKLANCRHAPHRDQPRTVLSEVAAWMRRCLPAPRA